MRQVRTLVIGLLCLLASGLHAKPSGPSLLCDTWPDTAECRGQLPSCSVCHTSTWPPAWNAFGLDLLTALAGQPFDAGVASALESIANNDPDGDGVASLTELNEGTAPGDSLSFGGYGPTTGPAEPLVRG